MRPRLCGDGRETLLANYSVNNRTSGILAVLETGRVLCLTDGYGTTMLDVPGRDLARTLRWVRRHRAESLAEVSTQSFADQLQREDAHINASLRYAREHLPL